MEDADLQEIRAKRLAQLQSEYGGRPDADKKLAERKQEQDEMKNSILSQILTQSARTRYAKASTETSGANVFTQNGNSKDVANFSMSGFFGKAIELVPHGINTLMVGKPEKGQMVENMLVQMARTGQIMGKLDESELISILEKINQQMHRKTTVKFDRRRAALDSDEEL